MIDKKVRLIAVLGETAEQATMLLTKILRSAGFIVSTLNQEEHSCKDALMTASKICDFIILNASLLKEDILKDFNLETFLCFAMRKKLMLILLKNLITSYFLIRSAKILVLKKKMCCSILLTAMRQI